MYDLGGWRQTGFGVDEGELDVDWVEGSQAWSGWSRIRCRVGGSRPGLE